MSDRRKNCPEGCPRYTEDLGHPCLFGVGPRNAKIMLCGECPGVNEDEKGVPFIGKSGQLLNKILEGTGLSRNDLYITNAVKCFTHNEDTKPTTKELNFCKKYLHAEIKKVQPTVIGVLGATAMEALTGRRNISKYKNNVYKAKDFDIKVVPTFHPAHVLRNPGNKPFFVKGIKLIAEEAASKEILMYKKDNGKYLLIDNIDKANQVLDKLMQQDEFSFDLETSALDYRIARILSIQFCWEERKAVAIPWEMVSNNETLLQKLKDLLLTDKLKIGQNIKFDIQMLLSHKVRVKEPWFDTMLAHHLIDENSWHDLETLTLQYTTMGPYWERLDYLKAKIMKKQGIKKDAFSYAMLPMKDLLLYGAKDADATYRLKNIFIEQLKKEDLYGFFNEHVMAYTPIIVEAELRGIKIDREKLKKLIVEYKEKLAAVEKDLYALDEVKKFEKTKKKDEEKKLEEKYNESAGKWAKKYDDSKNLKSRFPNGVDEYLEYKFPGGVKEYIEKRIKEDVVKFNFNSPKQLQGLLFDQMGLKPVKKTKTGYSTDKEVLETLADQGVEFIDALLSFRKLEKFISTYLVSTYEKSKIDGRIHTNYLQHGTVTGRTSSEKPNMQNLPRDAMDLKACMIADDGYVFVEADLAQAEFRCWAHYSEDPDMLNAIHSGLDIHTVAAMHVFDLPAEKITKEMRTAAKNCVFGLMFSRGAKSIAKQFGITIEQAEGVHEWFFDQFPVAAEWIERRPKVAAAKGFVKTWFGRKRRLPNINSDTQEVRAEADRQAKNSPIQAQSADMTKAYIRETLKRARKEGIDCFPSGEIHDAGIFQVKEGRELDFIKIYNEVVATLYPDFKCKMILESEVGKTLGTLKEVKLDD